MIRASPQDGVRAFNWFRIVFYSQGSSHARAEDQDMTPESEKILKKVTKELETEHDPDRREMLMVHKERFERLKAMSEKRNALSASRMPTPSEPEELRHPAREPVQNRPVGVQKFLLGLTDRPVRTALIHG